MFTENLSPPAETELYCFDCGDRIQESQITDVRETGLCKACTIDHAILGPRDREPEEDHSWQY